LDLWRTRSIDFGQNLVNLLNLILTPSSGSVYDMQQ
jgi:hypothetical protein